MKDVGCVKIDECVLIVNEDGCIYWFEDRSVGQIDVFDIEFEDILKDLFCELYSCNGFLTEV